MRVIRSRSMLGVALTVGAILLGGHAALAGPGTAIPMPITVIDPIVFPTAAGGDFDVDDNDYAKTLLDNGYQQDQTGLNAWTALAIQCSVVTPPTKGTLVQIIAPGKASLCDWTYTPGATWNGTDTMTYHIEYAVAPGSTTRVFTAPQTVNFSGPVTPPAPTPVTMPTLVDDTVIFTAATGGTFTVDTNDKQTTLTTNGWVPGTVAAEAQWTNLAVQCQAAIKPAHGAIVQLAGNSCAWTYTPNATFTGTDSMTYKMEYGTGLPRPLSSPATVTFKGRLIPAPVMVPDNVVFTNVPATRDFGASDNDLLASLSANGLSQDAIGNAAWAALGIQCEKVTPPAHGALTQLTTPGLGANCNWTYTPNSSFAGTDSMTYLIRYTDTAGTRVPSNVTTVSFQGPPSAPTPTTTTTTPTTNTTTKPVVLPVTVAPKFVPLSPARLLETRRGNVTVDGKQQGEGTSAAGSITEVQITGRATVPADATAVVLNVTATGTKAPGFLTVFPCGQNTPTASNLNYGNDTTIANAVTTKIGTGGKICIYTSAETNLITDINGYYPAGSTFTPLSPARLLETRPGNVTVDGQQAGQGTSAAGSITEVQVTGRTNMPTVPNDATAAVLNVTATGTKAPGFLTVFPCGQGTPTASNLNYGNDTTIANAVTTRIGTSGKICIYTSAETNLITDINGYYPAGSTFTPLSPARLLETRPGNVTVDGKQQGEGTSAAGSITEVQITGRATVPDDATAIVLNVTATGTKAPGFLTVFPCGQATPTASNLNYGNDTTIANAVTTKIGTSGKICIYTSAETNLITDINGYYSA
jgi:recombinational DNA repair protein RecR